MHPTFNAVMSTGSMFLGMLLLLEVGRRLGTRRLAADPQGARQGLGVVEGAVFSLLGLLIAFTFSGAANRFDARRELIIAEANAIGTAWLRIDALPASRQPAMRELFRQYLDARLATYQKLPDFDAAEAELARSSQLQGEIWTRALAACQDADASPSATMLFLPPLNNMFDLMATRIEATKHHPPLLIFILLAALSLAGSLLAGYGMAGGKNRSWIHILAFAAVMAAAVYVILDIEYPRFGFVRINKYDQVLIDLRASMK